MIRYCAIYAAPGASHRYHINNGHGMPLCNRKVYTAQYLTFNKPPAHMELCRFCRRIRENEPTKG